MSSKEFKPGDLVFELDFHGGIHLEVLKGNPNSALGFHKLTTRYGSNYSQCGRAYSRFKVPHLIHATPENRQALVTLFGEEAVPKIPLRGSELTKKMLERQKYVLCLVSNISEDSARNSHPPLVRLVYGVVNNWFGLYEGSVAEFAIPIDMDGNEITENQL